MLKICSLGEILIRLSASNGIPYSSLPENVEFFIGGSEANFLGNASNLGAKTYFLTALPDNFLGMAALKQLDRFRINREYVKILDSSTKMGTYFVEHGVANRASEVVYDRKNSAINLLNFDDYPFLKVFSKSNHYHITGITPGLSENAMDSLIRSLRLAKEVGLEVSCDLNYRAKLWDYSMLGEKVLPEKVMSDVAIYCDYLFGNEIDLQSFFNIEVKSKEYDYEKDNLAYYENLLLKISHRFPHIKIIALSIRKSNSASSNYMGGVLYIRETNQFFFSPNKLGKFKPYLIEPIVDRIGSGDAFSSGLIVGLKKYKSVQMALDFAVASSALKHTYRGDFSYATVKDIKSLMDGNIFGRIKR